LIDPYDIETEQYEFKISPSALGAGQEQPISSTFRVEIGAVSHPGNAKSHNEDHFLVARWRRTQQVLLTNIPDDQFSEYPGGCDGYSIIVADGMGGKEAGNVASRIAITSGLALFPRPPRRKAGINKREIQDLFKHFNDCLRKLDVALTRRNEAEHRLIGMGTTLTAAYITGADLFIIHLGNSRAYLYRDCHLSQLTKDHTVAQAMLDSGHFALQEVRDNAKSKVLTNFLGGHDGRVKVDVRWLRVKSDDCLLLCSDGLSDSLDDESIRSVLGAYPQPHDAAQELVDGALARGGCDDVTVAVARYVGCELVCSDKPEIA
jgi:serine/threonine protein phosphatase PrpC